MKNQLSFLSRNVSPIDSQEYKGLVITGTRAARFVAGLPGNAGLVGPFPSVEAAKAAVRSWNIDREHARRFKAERLDRIAREQARKAA